MWVIISDKTIINKGDKILRCPSYREKSTEQPTGKVENCDHYEVVSISLDGFTLKWLVEAAVDGMKLGNMTRQVNYSNLKNGEWWYKGGGQ